MTTTFCTVTEQDRFTLDFLDWLTKSYLQTGNEFVHRSDRATSEKDIAFLTAADCLAEFRKTYVSPIPLLPGDPNAELMAIAEEAVRRARIYFAGFQKITDHLNHWKTIPRQVLIELISETLNQIP